MKKFTLLTACIFGATAVLIGAFGAHGLRDLLIKSGRLDTFETAVRYQFYHTLALLAIGLLMDFNNNTLLRYASFLMIAGILIFSGSLYLLCLTNITIMGAITPLGGVSLVAGWVTMFLAIFKYRSDQ